MPAHNYSEIISWVMTNLGYSQIDVELDESQIITAFKDAIQAFAKYAGVQNDFKEHTFLSQQGISEYQMPDDCDYVFQCYRQNFSSSVGMLGIGFADDLILLFNTQGKTFDMYKNGLGFFASTSYLRFLGRTFGYEPTWENWKEGKVKLYPTPSAMLLVTCLYVPKIDLNTSIKYNLWIKYWTLARSKVMLGNIYQKYNGQIPGASGGSSAMISLRTDLVQEGKDDMQKLIEDLDSWRNRPVIIVG
jgi:hypothetical protein